MEDGVRTVIVTRQDSTNNRYLIALIKKVITRNTHTKIPIAST